MILMIAALTNSDSALEILPAAEDDDDLQRGDLITPAVTPETSGVGTSGPHLSLGGRIAGHCRLTISGGYEE